MYMVWLLEMFIIRVKKLRMIEHTLARGICNQIAKIYLLANDLGLTFALEIISATSMETYLTADFLPFSGPRKGRRNPSMESLSPPRGGRLSGYDAPIFCDYFCCKGYLAFL